MLRTRFGFSARAFSSSLRRFDKLTVKPEGAVSEVADLSGAPQDLQARVVRIYRLAPSATQCGTQLSRTWRIDWDIIDRANRWEDHTIGYASSGDYMQGSQMQFRTKDDAVRFATRQGWDYYIQEPRERTIQVKQYAENFLHSKGKLKHIRTK